MSKKKSIEKFPYRNCELVIIGGSAGGLSVILEIIQQLDRNFKIPIVIVLHRLNSIKSKLVSLLASKTYLNVKEVEDKEPVRSGYIYLAPANYHVLIETDKTFCLDYSEKINFSRPSIDPTCETAADIFKENVVGILLSGASSDGAAGLERIKAKGGTTVVQSPETADSAFMPEQAIKLGVRYILSAQEIVEFLRSLNYVDASE